MRYGLKIRSTTQNLFAGAADLVHQGVFDFIELALIPGFSQAKIVKSLSGLPMTFHAPHERHGVNLAIETLLNEKFIAPTLILANKVAAQRIIFHPGIHGTLEMLRNNLGAIHDPRMLIENMPYRCLEELGGGTCMGATFKELEILKKNGYTFCLDFGHAFKSALSQEKDPYDFIRELFSLDPVHFHLCDVGSGIEYDEHRNLGEGELNIKWIKKMLEKIKDPWLVFETPKEGKGLENDVRNLEYFKNV